MQKWMTQLILISALFLFHTNLSPASSKQMGRVKVVQNGLLNKTTGEYDSTAAGRTVVTAGGELLRGATFWCFAFHPNKVKYAKQFSAWQTLKDHHFNAVRLALNYEEPDKLEGNPEGEPFRWTLKEFLEQIDQWVDWAEELGLYVILDHHEVGTYTMEWLRTFWEAAAPRYADRPHVIYEIANEPVAWRPKNYTQEHINDFQDIYQLIREHAPETHVIFLSYAVPAKGMKSVADMLTGVDWSNASVGFHGYWMHTSAYIQELKAHYPAVNTEFMSHTPKNPASTYKMDGYLWQNQLMEKSGISWFIWDAAYRPDYIDKVLEPMLQHAEENGYAWWKESVVEHTPASMEEYALKQNYPNPFNPSTEIQFTLPHTAHVNLSIYDLHGRLIDTLVDAVMPSGSHNVSWNAANKKGITVPSGVYLYTLQSGDFSVGRRMVVMR